LLQILRHVVGGQHHADEGMAILHTNR
jgi:hypothetical protein